MSDPNLPPIVIPRRLAELNPDTVEWLARLNRKELDNLIVLCRASEEQRENLVTVLDWSETMRERLERFLLIQPEEFEAGFTVVTTVVRLKWLGIKGAWLIITVASILVAWNQISGSISKWFER